MSDTDADVTRLLRDLTTELQVLKRDLDRGAGEQLSTRQQLSEFTSEVAIPGLILLLETNIRALKLLRRAIRIAEGRRPQSESTGSGELRRRADKLGAEALSRLDETLARVQSSLEGEGDTDDIQQLLDEARQLQETISQQLGVEETAETEFDADVDDDSDAVTVDVDAELRTLKDNVDNTDDDSDDDR